MDTRAVKAVKNDVINWIKTLDDEELIVNLYYFKERYRSITTEEKEEIPDLPADMRSEIADLVLETLDQPYPNDDRHGLRNPAKRQRSKRGKRKN